MANVLTRDIVEEYITNIVNPDEHGVPIGRPRNSIRELHLDNRDFTGI